jgi:hypothetical protein
MSCATCRFWNINGEGPSIYTVDLTDLDELVDLMHPQRQCFVAVHANSGERRTSAEVAALPVIVLDASGYSARLFTLPTFTCAAEEPR